jgi:hypothetical protein
MAKTLERTQAGRLYTFPKSSLKLFVNKFLLQRDGVSKDAIQARFINKRARRKVSKLI